MVCWVRFPWVRFQCLYCSNVVCLYLDVIMGGFRCVMTLGFGMVMLMRGARATELCLMVGWVCVFVIWSVVLSSCGFWMCVLRFFVVLAALCNLCGFNLYDFGGGCSFSIG